VWKVFSSSQTYNSEDKFVYTNISSLNVNEAILLIYLNHATTHSRNQYVLRNEGNFLLNETPESPMQS